MTPERWQAVEKIYQSALDRDRAARSAFLESACAGDVELRRQVESLLVAHETGDRFLETPALEVEARALAGVGPHLIRGQRLGGYELIAPLGAGGMGEVWRARDPALEREVAIKFVLAKFSSDPERLRRFEQEARAVSQLNHPNILTVYAIGREEGWPYLVTELLEGETLRQRLAAGPLPESKAVEYAGQIAQGLAAAHEKGIAHRDLKPENIFLTRDGRAKILDFGLAKFVQTQLEHQDQVPTATASGVVLGTPAYMSPEQARGEAADHRSDIFALGAVLYEMLSGRRAFAGETSIETMHAILKHDPPPLARISAAVEQIVRHCLEKDPPQRFQSARDLSFQLRVAAHPSAPSQAWPHQRRSYAGVMLAGLLLTAAGLGWWLMHRDRTNTAPILTRVTSDSGLTTDPALSPDGKLIVYASDRSGDGNLDLWRQQLATGEAIRLTNDPADESEPVFSPDGNRIAFRSERDGGGIYVISAYGGGEPRLLVPQGRRPRFSPDGAYIAYWVGAWYMGKAFFVPSAGGTPTAIQPEFASIRDPIWSPDGKQFLFPAARNLPDVLNKFDWWVAPRDGGPAMKSEAFTILRQQKITDGIPLLVAPAGWLGDRVLFSARLDDLTSLWYLAVSPSTGKASGLPHRLTAGTTVEAKPSVTPGGEIAFASLTQNLNIWSLPIDANRGLPKGNEQKLTHSAYDAHTSLSADGRKLVFISTRSGNPDVWMKDLSTGKETNLTATPWTEEQPEITADGSRVCYLVLGQKPSIYQMSTSGGVPEKLCEDCIRPWDWSPDGKKLLYLLGEGRDNRPQASMAFGLIDVATRQKTAYLEHPRYGVARPRFSPDGRWISFGAFERPGFTHIMIAPFETPAPAENQWIAITDATTFNDKPRWSPDGNLLYFTSDGDGYRCIYARRLEPKTKLPLGKAFAVYHSHNARRSLINIGFQFMDISLSRDKMFFNLGETTGNIWMAKVPSN